MSSGRASSTSRFLSGRPTDSEPALYPLDVRRHCREAAPDQAGSGTLLEAEAIDNKLANLISRIRTGLVRHRRLILVVVGGLLVAGIAYLFWAQKQANEYEEAFRKGLNFWNHREAEKALPELRKAAKTDPRNPELWVLIGRSELASGHPDRALEAWEEALRREPGFKPALFERGKEALGRHIARRIPPTLDRSTGWLPLQLEPVGRVEGGTDEFNRIWADVKAGAFAAPEFARFARGTSDLLEGRYGDAGPNFRAYTDRNGWDVGALALIGISLHYGGLSSRAEQALSEALALKSETLWFRVRAEARYLQGKYEQAREDYRQAGLEKEAEPLFARRIPSQGLILWLRADAGVEVTGGSVSRWSDQSSGRHDAAPKDPAGGPRVTPSAIRGRPAVLFSGMDDELRLPDGFEDFSAGLSVFVVGEPQAPAGDPWSFIYLATGQAGALPIEALLGRRRESEALVYSVEDMKSASPPFVTGVVPLKEFEGLGAVQEPSGKVRLYKRGLPVATGTLTLPGKTVRTRNRVGAGFKGHLAEILLYNRGLSDLERLGVEAYLKDRYFPDAAAVAPSAEKR
jgi:tetratricopeptide (TPR) repeat protein